RERGHEAVEGRACTGQLSADAVHPRREYRMHTSGKSGLGKGSVMVERFSQLHPELCQMQPERWTWCLWRSSRPTVCTSASRDGQNVQERQPLVLPCVLSLEASETIHQSVGESCGVEAAREWLIGSDPDLTCTDKYFTY